LNLGNCYAQAETLISLQRYVLVLTLRLAVHTLFRKGRSNLGKHFLHPQKYALPYTYGCAAQSQQKHSVIAYVSIII